MSEPRLSAPIGLKEVLKLMGKEPTPQGLQDLRRVICRRERVLGTKITFQAKRGKPHQTTLAALKQTMPDLFDRDMSSVQEVRALLKEYTEQIEDMKETTHMALKQVEILAKAVEKLQERLTRLENSAGNDGQRRAQNQVG